MTTIDDHLSTLRAALAVNPSHLLAPSITAVCDELERARVQICRLVSGQAIESDHMCQHHDADVAALADVASLRAELAESNRQLSDAVAARVKLVAPVDPEEVARAYHNHDDAPAESWSINARAVLRYVPAGDVTGMDALVTARVVETVGGLPVIELGPRIGFVAPDSARRIAHALHAAADAAEETTR